jgi:hypothetical protein
VLVLVAINHAEGTKTKPTGYHPAYPSRITITRGWGDPMQREVS